MANNLSLSNVLNVSVEAVQPGLGTPNTGNLAIFSREPYASSFGTAGYKIYFSPAQAAIDWGTGSNTYAMVLAAFTIQPNILAPGGYIVVIPFLSGAQDQQVLISFPGQPAAGNFYVSYNSNATAAIAFNATAATVQTDLQSVTGLSSATATGAINPATGLAIDSMVSGVGHPFVVLLQYLFTVSSANATTGATYTDADSNVYTVVTTISGQTTLTTNGIPVVPPASGTLTKTSGTGDSTITFTAFATLQDANGVPVLPVVNVVVPGSTAETLDQAIIRTQPLVAYFGVIATEVATQVVTLAAARYIQSQNLIGGFVSYTSSDLEQTGTIGQLAQLQLTQSRGLFYDDQLSTALIYLATYFSLLLSVDYTGNLTTLTMNLKTLPGVAVDPNITQALVNTAKAAGADVYVSLSGVPKVLSFGANDFADNQTNLRAFVLFASTSYFNALATTNTKIPQTEDGMNVLKAAVKQVCQQFATPGGSNPNGNGFLAPGVWTNPTVFGPPGALVANIAQFGFYVFSAPIATQSPTQRNARIAPTIQVALKFAGAEQSGNMIVFLNP